MTIEEIDRKQKAEGERLKEEDRRLKQHHLLQRQFPILVEGRFSATQGFKLVIEL
jgi:hypothetical protein